MTHEELLHGRPARISTRSTNGTPRTTCGAVLPGTEPNRHVPANRRFYGARTPVSASAGAYRGRTDSCDSSFVLRIRNSTKQQPRRGARGGGRTLDGTRPPRDRLRLGGPRGSPRANARRAIPDTKIEYTRPNRRAYARSRRRWRAMAGRARPAPPPRRPARRAHVPGHGPNRPIVRAHRAIRTIKNSLHS